MTGALEFRRSPPFRRLEVESLIRTASQFQGTNRKKIVNTRQLPVLIAGAYSEEFLNLLSWVHFYSNRSGHHQKVTISLLLRLLFDGASPLIRIKGDLTLTFQQKK